MWHQFRNLFVPRETVRNNETVRNDIDNDSQKINQLVLAAKDGEWESVWRILGDPKRPNNGHLINIIPEGRRWGILHQAIFWNSTAVLRKLLSYESCDNTICTKESTFKDGSIGTKDPRAIVAMYGCEEMLREFGEDSSTDSQKLPTHIPYEDQDKYPKCYRFLEVVLAAYKQAFHPKPISRSSSIYEILKAIFEDFLTSRERFESIKEKVCESIKGVHWLASDTIEAMNTPDDFCSGIIFSYSIEMADQLYSRINLAMRRQTSQNYQPTACDFSIGPYVLMYQMLLLYWDGIKKDSEVTYRRMLVQDEDLVSYQVGQRFIWPSVTSSTVDVKKTVAFPTFGHSGDNVVVFTIDNSTSSKWQPRNIEKHACYLEGGRTYPGAAPFKVTKRQKKDKEVHIHLKLLARW